MRQHSKSNKTQPKKETISAKRAVVVPVTRRQTPKKGALLLGDDVAQLIREFVGDQEPASGGGT